MASTFSKKFISGQAVRQAAKTCGEAAGRFFRSPTVRAAAISVALGASRVALAQSIGGENLTGLCVIPQILKFVVGIVALGALLVWTIAHMNNKNELSDLTLRIAVPCVLAGIAGYLITQFGLASNCSGIS